MISVSVREIEECLRPVSLISGTKRIFSRVSIDTRTLKKGSLFLVTCVQDFFGVVKNFWKTWGICTLRYARSKTPIAGSWLDSYTAWKPPLEKKVGSFWTFYTQN